MAKVHKLSGYEEFIGSIDKIAATAKNVNVLFTGKKDQGGRSWCPDCVDGKLIIFNSMHSNSLNKCEKW